MRQMQRNIAWASFVPPAAALALALLAQHLWWPSAHHALRDRLVALSAAVVTRAPVVATVLQQARSPRDAAHSGGVSEVWVDADHLRVKRCGGQWEDVPLMPLASRLAPPKQPWFRRYLPRTS